MSGGGLVRVVMLFAIFCAGVVCAGQAPASDDPPNNQITFPAISFTLDFPAANPSHYLISVGHDGRGTYVCNLQRGTLEFTISDRVRVQIFDLAQRAHYFSGKVDSGHKGLANTGAKTLVYRDGQRESHATYNYSTSAPVEQLTAIFQNLSETLEFGRRLSFFHKYQKTALDEELKRMEELQRENSLGDPQAIAPVLKEIADDQSVMNVARARALRLMAGGTK